MWDFWKSCLGVCVYIERELTNASALAEGKSQGCTASPLGIVMALNG